MTTVFERLKELPDYLYYPIISHIRFPRYKNLIPNFKIEFKYPITALVGVNGASKSSVLRAIYGSPKNKSIEDYWFETDVDHVNDAATSKSAFVYGYYNQSASRNVEVVKVRIKKDKNPDYWEPSRPLQIYEMERMPPLEEVSEGQGRSKTRWNTIEKNVVYLDFRHEAISAFDRCFYVNSFKKTKTIESKQDFIRRYAKNLQVIINRGLNSYNLYGRNRVLKNEHLTTDIIKKISQILGKNYTSIQIVEHDLYTSEFAKTIYLSCGNNLSYSEAFAGSGEFAIVSLVKAVMEAPDKSLIILDEPEVSIHPGAQEKMLEFLAEQALSKHHQIVFTTHSPAMIRKLPPEAIHVLYLDANGNTNVRSCVHAEEAFVEIGAAFEKKTIIVEDKMAKLVIEKILKDRKIFANFDVLKAPNGAEWIKKNAVLTHSLANTDNVLFILDGDKKKEHQDPDNIPPSDNIRLSDIIYEQTGCRIEIPHEKDNEEDKIAKQRDFLKYYKDHVFYFPVDDPEEILWEYADGKDTILETDIKKCFCKLSCNMFGDEKSEHIFSVAEICANKMDTSTNDKCQELLHNIENFLQ